ncbi:hypothetical protein CASFOL_033624 [Castilleja foliolosa]|uniref:Uncharacterized protein n=1 Tax=Castilleja foliolosa TaxID=1961234 RepID=A0ABD3BXH0_9LAMI
MAEHVMSLDQENKVITNNGPSEKDDETDHHHHHEEEENADLETNNKFHLSGLNLAMILSFLSSSSDDSHNSNETIHDTQMGNHTKHGSCSQARRREINQFPAVERQSSKVHTKIRDSRHCRRL